VARVVLVGKAAPERGGIPTFLQMLMTSKQLAGHQVRLVNLGRGDAAVGGRVSATNMRRTVLDCAAVWRGARGADVVHVHTALAPTSTAVRAAALCLVARARGCRVLLHVHGGLVLLWLHGRVRRLLLRGALRSCDLVVTVSPRLFDLLGELAPGKVRHIDNGVDTELFTGGPAGTDPPRVLVVGLLVARKGMLDVFEASRLLRSRGVAHVLQVVAGTTTEGAEAEGRVRSLAPPWAELSGSVPSEQMPAVYRAADVFCLPSWYEAMPLSVLEAAATGLPVVATDVGDVSRIVQDGRTGYVVPARCPDRLADALEALLVDESRRREMGRAGRAHVTQQFSAASTARRIGDLYDGTGGAA
jgi:glycosyltransferase involved in cell wall biosynthesis